MSSDSKLVFVFVKGTNHHHNTFQQIFRTPRANQTNWHYVQIFTVFQCITQTDDHYTINKLVLPGAADSWSQMCQFYHVSWQKSQTYSMYEIIYKQPIQRAQSSLFLTVKCLVQYMWTELSLKNVRAPRQDVNIQRKRRISTYRSLSYNLNSCVEHWSRP